MPLKPCTDARCHCEGTRPGHTTTYRTREHIEGTLHYHGYTAAVLRGDPLYAAAQDDFNLIFDDRGVKFVAGEPWHLWQSA